MEMGEWVGGGGGVMEQLCSPSLSVKLNTADAGHIFTGFH